MTPKKFTYKKIRSKIISSKEPYNLLLGNGFSIAFDNMFNIDEGKNEEMGKFFSHLFNNFELKKEPDKVDKITLNDYSNNTNFRNTMFWRVAKNHLENFSMIRLSEARACLDFLSFYLSSDGKIFTLNYDMLLNWVLIRASEAGFDNKLFGEIKDGFTAPKNIEHPNRYYWDPKNEDEQNLYYCHGALNLFLNDDQEDENNEPKDCYKLKHGMLSKESVITDFFDTGKVPMIVSSNDYLEKKQQINESSYLINCLKALSEISGNLVIFGVSFSQNDDHIIEALKKAQSDNGLDIYYGFHSEKDLDKLKEIILDKNLLEIKGVYKSTSAKIWRE